LRSDILLTDISVFIQNYSEFFSQRIFKPALFIFQGSDRSQLVSGILLYHAVNSLSRLF